jgi:hypothetical protein
MTAVPLHIKRQFEQRWASRFNPPDASTSPQDIRTKTSALEKKEATTKTRLARKRVGKSHGVGG